MKGGTKDLLTCEDDIAWRFIAVLACLEHVEGVTDLSTKRNESKLPKSENGIPQNPILYVLSFSLLILPIWCTPDNCYFLGPDQNNSKLPPTLANTCIVFLTNKTNLPPPLDNTFIFTPEQIKIATPSGKYMHYIIIIIAPFPKI